MSTIPPLAQRTTSPGAPVARTQTAAVGTSRKPTSVNGVAAKRAAERKALMTIFG